MVNAKVTGLSHVTQAQMYLIQIVEYWSSLNRDVLIVITKQVKEHTIPVKL